MAVGGADLGDVGGVALLTAVLIAVALVVAWTVRLGAPPWPSAPRARRALLAAAPPAAEIRGDILELGCGWGGLALALAARYPERRVIAVELSPVPWAVARLRARAARVENLEVRRADLHRVDLSRAGLVVCYLHRAAMTRLADRLEREAPAGVWVVSNTFGLGTWRPLARHPVGDLYGTEVLLYRQDSQAESRRHDHPGPYAAGTPDRRSGS
ncbi:class I SAM-dependent methyltransferase [Roseospira goensis]|uniref:SAM-dependent methyltransferase n=1 Tax=Roseospira goensis TaxID=391922 RepID=A0A7W6RX05_9PROT|nr:class I SAM-dependent methyltransferase [Roseospira goensis]MBB4284636.1 SAM-dependent methyltransferase [Roseospira goensis]